MADATVVFSAEIDDKQALAELNRLQNRIRALTEQMEAKGRRRNILTDQLKDVEAQYKAAIGGGQDELAQSLAKQYDSIASKIATIDQQLKYQNADLDAAKEQAGQYAAQLSRVQAPAEQTAQATDHIATETDKTTQEMQKLGSAGNEAAQKISKGFSGAGSGISKFGKRLVGLAKRVFVFSMITMALRNVRKWLLNMINTNSEASAALAQLKGAFLTFAQPLLNVLIPALTKVIQVITQIVSAIASLVASLFGTTVQASAEAAENLYNEQNALEGVGGAAKKASKQLANFDEINQLTGDNAGGGSGGGSSTVKPNFQIDDGLVSKVQDFLDKTGLGKAISELITSVGRLKKSLEEFWNSPAGQAVKLIISDVFILAIRALATALSVLAAVLSGDLWSALDSLQSLSFGAIFTVLKAVASILDLIYGKPIKKMSGGKGIRDFVEEAEQWVAKLPSISEAWQRGMEAWSNVWEKIKYRYGILWDRLKERTTAAFKEIQEAWGIIKGWWDVNVAPIFEKLFQPIKDAWEAMTSFFHNTMEHEAEEGGLTVGKALLAGVKSGLVGLAALINGIISAIETAINFIVNKINGISFDLPNNRVLFGDLAGQHVGFNLPPVSIPRINIPGLAEGAVIPPNREFLAVLGDQTRGTNIEAPLDTIVAAFRRVMAEQGNGRQTIVLELDRRELGRAVADVSRLESQRVGLKIGGSYA